MNLTQPFVPLFAIASLALSGIASAQTPAPKKADQVAADADGFVPMFNGTDMTGWTLPEPVVLWRANPKTGELQRKGGGGYLWSKKAYGDFVIELEFKMSPGCNSGIFVRTNPADPVQGGFEIQILDTAAKGDSAGKTDAGALYDASKPMVNAVKPANQWNKIRIEWIGPKLKVTLNGKVVQDLDIDDWDTASKNPDGTDNKFKTALKDLPRAGHIGFQDHGHNVSFRNIRIKEVTR